MSRIMVTGGAGFIGSHLAEALLAQGHRVIVLDNLSTGSVENVPPAARLIIGDLCDYAHLAAVLGQQSVDYVYHLAASSTDASLYRAKHADYTENLLGSINVIDFAIRAGARCVVFTSSTSVYGRNPTAPVREDGTPAFPEDSHSIAKLAVEQELRLAQQTVGLDYVIFRLHNVCGARRRYSGTSMDPVNRCFVKAALGNPVQVIGDGEANLSFSDVRDIASLLAEAVNMPAARNQIFNAGADHTYTKRQLAATLFYAAGSVGIGHAGAKRQTKALISQDKLETVFGQRPTRDISETLASVASWLKIQDPADLLEFAAAAMESRRQ